MVTSTLNRYSLLYISQKISKARVGKRVVLVSGVFDILHYGHIVFLQNAKKYGDILVVQIDADSLVKIHKGSFRPYCSAYERARLIESLHIADYVYISELEPHDERQLKEIFPNVVVKVKRGVTLDAMRLSDYRRVNSNILVKYISSTGSIASTRIIKDIQKASTVMQTVPKEIKIMLTHAKRAADHGYSISGFRVGACILAGSGKIYCSGNISNSSPALAMCAERIAVTKEINNGERLINAIAIVNNTNEVIFPCGLCRQVLFEFCANPIELKVYCANNNLLDIHMSTMQLLLPNGFISVRR